MIAHLVAIFALSAVGFGQDCGGNPALACMDNTECAVGTCFKANPADFLGCCRVINFNCQLNPQTGVSDCPARSYLCGDAVYLMRQQCPRTCNYCTAPAPNPPSTACVDLINPNTGVSDCPGLRPYCSNAVYLTLMRQQCRRTCGFC
ncbi:hypothetical protein PRIPAC_92262 [Pristionchus pacificus]|uniref:ShK domain-containing protein n=1 Tax=Pristionchus pacificus TaxID=54126 RepID=A0A2A6CD14_PRIPA|nr:hypothetical protein PRIPAC_92262 [Pristionchus pacificus]|eukprot:PDM76007.1 ShK domain-containing protein [Pristionchus pacificus]